MTDFEIFPLRTGVHADLRTDAFPSSLTAWQCGSLRLEAQATHFGYVFSGRIRLQAGSGVFELGPGMYFAAPGPAAIECLDEEGGGMVASRIGYRGFFQIGGPIEGSGRLRYIDGCTDSLLAPPVQVGDPCLNLLHFPPGIRQTAHTHPSLRLGMVASGRGACRLARGQVPLEPGAIFLIPAETVHGFLTGDRDMTVIAYHPDSDFGPDHQDHPMINRTLVEGTSAKYLSGIQTTHVKPYAGAAEDREPRRPGL